MENQQSSSNFMLYLMLIVCSVLASMNSLEIYRMSSLWKQALNLKADYFHSCVKPQYIVKTFFCFYSFFATFSGLILTIGLLVDYVYFARKLIESYLKFVYFVFGLTLLFSCILALVNWKDTFFLCSDDLEKHFSLTNATSVLFCFFIAGFITVLVEFYSVMSLFSDTITRQPTGSKALFALFWYVSFKIKNTTRFISSRHTLNQSNGSNSENNLNDNINVNLLVRENNVNLDNVVLNNHQEQNAVVRNSVGKKDRNDKILEVKNENNNDCSSNLIVKEICENKEKANIIREN